jgi:hypothetical protein
MAAEWMPAHRGDHRTSPNMHWNEWAAYSSITYMSYTHERKEVTVKRNTPDTLSPTEPDLYHTPYFVKLI